MTNANRPAPHRRVTPPWVWLLLIGGFGLIFYQFVPKREGPNRPPAPPFEPWLLLLWIGPQISVITCIVSLHTCLALGELGRWDEAHEQFRFAEEAAGTLRKAHRAALDKAFEKCRQKLEQQPRDKPKPEGLTEF